MTGPDRRTRQLVIDRAGRICERCEIAPGEQIHHRRPRMAGGTKDPRVNLPSNLVLLCGACHRWVESHREEARDDGWLLRSVAEAATAPVVSTWGLTRTLSDDGTAITDPLRAFCPDGARPPF